MKKAEQFSTQPPVFRLNSTLQQPDGIAIAFIELLEIM